MPSSQTVAEAIAAALDRSDRISFETFMELALYHDPGGYYVSGPGAKGLGRRGDYFTSVSVGACFGFLLARQVADLWRQFGRPSGFTLVEAGANDGPLARDIHEGLKSIEPDLAESLRWVLVETSPALRRDLARSMPMEVRCLERLDPLREAPVTGLVLANELIDALPVRRVRFENGAWRELFVTRAHDGGGGMFAWRSGPVCDQGLAAELERLGRDFPDGYTTEINLRAGPWVRSAAAALRRGGVLIIDYGYPSARYYHATRTDGTLRTFSRHRAGDDPLANPGELDITAHVDFTRLADAARSAGLAVAGFSDQNRYLTRLAEPWLRSLENNPAHQGGRDDAAFIRQFKTLTFGGSMGRSFHALALSKSTAAGAAAGDAPPQWPALPGNPWDRLR